MVVWGDVFTRLYTELVIPTQLSAQNLPALSASAEVTYHIHATRSAEVMIRDSPLFAELARTVHVAFDTIEDHLVSTKNKYALLTACHRRSLAVACERDEALIFLGPDGVFADGCFPRLHELVIEGFRAVMITGLRADKSGFIEDMRIDDDVPSARPIVLPPRRLVRLLTGNLHAVEQALLWREEELSSWPSHLLWRVGETGLLARSFHLHPLLIWPQRWRWRGGELDTIDSSLVTQAIPEVAKIRVVTDSDEIAACELSDEISAPVHRATPNLDCGTKRVAAWMRRSTDALQRSHVQHRFRLHADDLSSAVDDWREVERRSDEVITRIQRDLREVEVEK